MANISKHINFSDAKRMGVWSQLKFYQCNTTYRGRALYVIEFEGGGVKVGIAKNLVNRLKEYNKPWIKNISNIRCYRHTNPYSLELLVKRHFNHIRHKISSEYFETNFQTVINFIENYKFHSTLK